ncbi:hypothetical protein PHPALM_31518 [Phytophthora palmivora]|uniref:Uncharacterized protein n=1 Tax=Phytophthora palmivora TaxID=4796 RepID=A0A2P4X2D0_9STRA|nr:hypothetical protein PHPALM_31518 [Phytophthora palmivora]
MEVVTLNERLRSDFSALLKLLPPPYAVSVLSTLKRSIYSPISPVSAPSTDRYTQHCRQMLWRLNSYQYGSASAFLLDLEQLERVATSSEVKKHVQSLLSRLAVSEGEKQGQESHMKVANKRDKEETEANTTWLCNVSLRDQIVTIGTFKTREEALQGYEEQRKLMAESAAGFNKLRQLATTVEAEQREEDKRVLREALAQCHPRLTAMRVSAVVPPAPPVNAVVPSRGVQRIMAKTIATSSPVASPAPSETGASPPKASRASKRQKTEGCASTVKKQRIEASNLAASMSSGSRSYLKLRRLIQKRLCRHLKGKEVCVLSNPDFHDDTRLRATGRLEAGKVYSFRKKKQMTFADYVRDELGRAESACAHMFLVRTKESIDDHLKVCDAFSDDERELGHPQPAKSKKASRRR